jgi:hypothetical protein
MSMTLHKQMMAELRYLQLTKFCLMVLQEINKQMLLDSTTGESLGCSVTTVNNQAI